MSTTLTPNEEAAAVTSCDGLNFVFSTTHPLTKEQTNAYYHA